jgi:hypothetical protein
MTGLMQRRGGWNASSQSSPAVQMWRLSMCLIQCYDIRYKAKHVICKQWFSDASVNNKFQNI